MDERKLLLLIKNHPEIYNNNHKHYNKLEVTSRAWRAIADELNEEVNYCKKRWKNIRLVAIRDFTDPNKKSDYYLKDYLQFYLPFMKLKKIQIKTEKKSVDDEINKEISDPLFEDEIIETIEINDQNDVIAINEYLENNQNVQQNNSKEINQILNSGACNDETISFDDLNCDKAFLMSIFNDFNTLDARRKRIFKGRVINLLNELHDNATKIEDLKEFTIKCGTMKWSASNIT